MGGMGIDDPCRIVTMFQTYYIFVPNVIRPPIVTLCLQQAYKIKKRSHADFKLISDSDYLDIKKLPDLHF